MRWTRGHLIQPVWQGRPSKYSFRQYRWNILIYHTLKPYGTHGLLFKVKTRFNDDPKLLFVIVTYHRGKRGIKERLSFENSCNSGKGMWNHWVCYTASLGIVLGYLKIFE